MELRFTKDGIDYNIRPATLADAEEVVALINICSQELYGKDELELDEVLADWQLKGTDLKLDSIVVLADEKLIAFADLVDVVAPFVRYPLMARVHPLYRGQGFGWLINRWAQGRVEELIERAPAETRVFMISIVHEKNQAGRQLLEDLGGKLERLNWLMERELLGPLPEVRLPEGYRLRVAKTDEYRQIFTVKQQAFQDHWGFIPISEEQGFENFMQHFVQDPHYQPELFLVAESEEQIVAMLIATPASSYGDDYGWISVLGVLPAHRHKGIGKALLLRAFAELKLFGCERVGLWVDSDSLTGATRLYQQAGMQVVAQFNRYETTMRAGVDLRRLK